MSAVVIDSERELALLRDADLSDLTPDGRQHDECFTGDHEGYMTQGQVEWKYKLTTILVRIQEINIFMKKGFKHRLFSSFYILHT